MSRITTALLAGAGLLGLAACGGPETRTTGENVEAAFDRAADNAEKMADNATLENTEATLERSADALEEGGEKLKQQIDRGQVDGKAIENSL